jgi:hypothetical protein
VCAERFRVSSQRRYCLRASLISKSIPLVLRNRRVGTIGRKVVLLSLRAPACRFGLPVPMVRIRLQPDSGTSTIIVQAVGDVAGLDAEALRQAVPREAFSRPELTSPPTEAWLARSRVLVDRLCHRRSAAPGRLGQSVTAVSVLLRACWIYKFFLLGFFSREAADPWRKDAKRTSSSEGVAVTTGPGPSSLRLPAPRNIPRSLAELLSTAESASTGSPAPSR